MASTCNFGDYLQTAIRNQCVFGLKCVNAQKRCLEAENLTLDKAISIGKAFEMTEKASVDAWIKERRYDWKNHEKACKEAEKSE